MPALLCLAVYSDGKMLPCSFFLPLTRFTFFLFSVLYTALDWKLCVFHCFFYSFFFCCLHIHRYIHLFDFILYFLRFIEYTFVKINEIAIGITRLCLSLQVWKKKFYGGRTISLYLCIQYVYFSIIMWLIVNFSLSSCKSKIRFL